MKGPVAERFAEEINGESDYIKSWADVHGQDEAEVIVEVDYRNEGPFRLLLESKRQAMAVFQLIFASKEQGLEEAKKML
jgi:hypothetical protein